MFDHVRKSLNIALEDWSMMQKTDGDEGEETAERFERHFYEFIDHFKSWFHTLNPMPTDVLEAEDLPEVIEIQNKLPGPLQLNFLTELELIIDGIERSRFD